MFDRFTERACRVMTLAGQEARKLNNDYIGTEHILLGLLQEGNGVAVQVLKNLDVDLSTARVEVERLAEQGTSPVSGTLPFTPRAKHVLELALEEAQDLGHNYIGTEHLLLGLMREKDGPAALVLQILGVKPEEIREEVVEIFGFEPRLPPVAPAGGRGAVYSVPYTPQLGFGSHDGFTLQAAEVLRRTETVARAFRHDYLGVEHLLIALVDGEGIAAWVLRKLGLDRMKIEAETNRVNEQLNASSDARESPPGLLPLTPRLHRILLSAVSETKTHGLGCVGTQEILEALVFETDGPAADVLKGLRVDPDRIREELRVVRESDPRSTGAPTEIAPPPPPDQTAREEARALVEAILQKRAKVAAPALFDGGGAALEVTCVVGPKGWGYQLWLARALPDGSTGTEVALWASDAMILEEHFAAILDVFGRLACSEAERPPGGGSIKK